MAPASEIKIQIVTLLTVWDITWMSGQAHALGQVDGSTWTSDSHAPGQVPFFLPGQVFYQGLTSPGYRLAKCKCI